MAKRETNWVLCHFRVKPGKEDAFLEVCREHESVLRALGLATDEPTTIYRGSDTKGRPFLYKTFEWISATAVETAHQHPELMKVWERMEDYCEERDGWPSMEFPHVERLTL